MRTSWRSAGLSTENPGLTGEHFRVHQGGRILVGDVRGEEQLVPPVQDHAQLAGCGGRVFAAQRVAWMIEIANEPVAHPAQERHAPHDPAADERAAHPRICPHFARAASCQPHRSLGVIGRQSGDDVHSAADDVAAVERPLRPAEHLDPLEIQKVREETSGPGQIDPVEIHGGARIGSRKDHVGADAANGQLRKARVLRERERGGQPRQMLHRVNVRTQQFSGRQHAHGHRERLYVTLTALGRGDHGVFLEEYREGQRDAGGLAGGHPDAPVGRREAGCRRGQRVVAVGEIRDVEPSCAIGSPGAFHQSAECDRRSDQWSARRVGHDASDSCGRLRVCRIRCAESACKGER